MHMGVVLQILRLWVPQDLNVAFTGILFIHKVCVNAISENKTIFYLSNNGLQTNKSQS